VTQSVLRARWSAVGRFRSQSRGDLAQVGEVLDIRREGFERLNARQRPVDQVADVVADPVERLLRRVEYQVELGQRNPGQAAVLRRRFIDGFAVQIGEQNGVARPLRRVERGDGAPVAAGMAWGAGMPCWFIPRARQFSLDLRSGMVAGDDAQDEFRAACRDQVRVVDAARAGSRSRARGDHTAKAPARRARSSTDEMTGKRDDVIADSPANQ
jgi:hypothetical protein